MRRLRRKLESEVLWIYVAYLLREGDKTAHELKRLMADRFTIRVSSLKLYLVLYRLEDEGLVKRVSEGPVRFALTERGELEFRKAITYLEERLMTLKQHIKL